MKAKNPVLVAALIAGSGVAIGLALFFLAEPPIKYFGFIVTAADLAIAGFILFRANHQG